ncbi:hypothetical protein B296_00041910 [Ensete ventricosum]|uniref:Uncharacterized protein n=1 Tax=Ensete ventricosum TaxID=4639 RepID=A0A426ZK33_ENSVE|nr:hypothetical protein B296_00041910 [Ensete ventricosum]
MLPHLIPSNASDPKKIERQAFSGPLTSKPPTSKPASSTTNSMSSVEHMPGVPAKPTNIPIPKLPLPPTSPRINELHELPRPPIIFSKHTGPSNLIGHSAPLVSRGQDLNATCKPPSVSSHTATPLPKPPGVMARSFSIPSSGQRSNSTVPKSLDLPRNQRTTADTSPPHTLMNIGVA